MKPIKIYRIEDESGRGMYRSSLAPGCVQEMQPFDIDAKKEHHPTPRNDERLWEKVKDAGLCESSFFAMFNKQAEDYYFGFSSIKQLRSWV